MICLAFVNENPIISTKKVLYKRIQKEEQVWHYKKGLIIYLFLFLYPTQILLAQPTIQIANEAFLKKLLSDTAYLNQKQKIIHSINEIPKGEWGEFVKGVGTELAVSGKVVALTFDACGGIHGDQYDSSLVQYLRKMKIPATMFITGRWIDKNYKTFMELSRDTLFEIENHGLNHRPCSVAGESVYGIKGTPDISQAYDEIEVNERKIYSTTGRRPLYYRSATAYMDEKAVVLAGKLHVTPISYGLLSGDAVPYIAAEKIEQSVMTRIRPGAIIIMHMNHPEWNTCEALFRIIPALQKQGYAFARLKDYSVKRKK